MTLAAPDLVALDRTGWTASDATSSTFAYDPSNALDGGACQAKELASRVE